ncbi:MAG: phosphatidate cytidylyltransferase [Planctomycetes bacterium]|nr:phosphatidate cytidylyltransferase [Planctomycetota bacterium]
MIRTRVIVGTILALAAGGILIGDDHLVPGWFPCLFVCLMALGVIAGRELVRLIPSPFKPSECLVVTGTVLCLAANWVPLAVGSGTVWQLVVVVLAATLMLALLLEMHRFTGEVGVVVPRLGTTMLAVSYLGVLPCFFAQIRFLPHPHASLLLALTIFVPKCNDIAAFFTGTFLGRHKMTPVLSPKKTWEGFAGGMLGGVAVAVGVHLVQPIFGGTLEAIGFGLAVGIAGILGDLSESLIKRDCQTKDASKSIPGFGGLLDVVDSVLFAAPVAYLWFSWK